MSIYQFTVKDKNNQDVSLDSYQGQVVLIVNTATGCGFTPQYEGLEALYQQHHQEGFEILDFPCNQFNEQAPGSMEEIASFCSLTYNTTFPLFMKVDVKGSDAAPLFTYLTQEKGGLLNKTIKWNFTKFLVNRQGKVVKRYAPTVEPKKIEKDIIALLKENA